MILDSLADGIDINVFSTAYSRLAVLTKSIHRASAFNGVALTLSSNSTTT